MVSLGEGAGSGEVADTTAFRSREEQEDGEESDGGVSARLTAPPRVCAAAAEVHRGSAVRDEPHSSSAVKDESQP